MAKIIDSQGNLLMKGDIVEALSDHESSEIFRGEHYVFRGPGKRPGTVELSLDDEGVDAKVVPLECIALVQSLRKYSPREADEASNPAPHPPSKITCPTKHLRSI